MCLSTNCARYRAVVHQEEAPARLFAAAEAAEFQQANPAKAAEHYRALAASKDRPVRAAALMRLARALRNQQRGCAYLCSRRRWVQRNGSSQNGRQGDALRIG